MAEAQTAKKPATRILMDEIAADRLADLLSRFRDPDAVLEEAGLTRADLRKLEGDDEIAAALETRLNACLATPWRLEPGDGPITEFVWEQLEPHIERILTGAWQAIPYGYAVQEVIYRRGPRGRILWDRIEERPFEWFRPTPRGELRYHPGGVGASGIDGRSVDTVFKFFLTRRKPSSRLPMGQALLARLYWPWFFRNAGWRFWARFLERFGAPLLVAKTVGSPDDMADSLARAVQSAVVAIGVDEDVEAIASSGSGEAFLAFSRAVDRRIQKVILGQTLTTDVDGKGSYAAARVHDAVRNDRRLADIRLLSGTVQRMIDALVALNFPAAEPPRFVMEDGAGLETERAERDARLVQAGILRLTEDYLLRVYDFEPGDFVVPEPDGGTAGGAAGSVRAGLSPGTGTDASPAHAGIGPASTHAAAGEAMPPSARGGRPRFTPAQQAVEALADRALAQAGDPIPAERIREAVRLARTPDDLYDRLARLYEGTDAEAFRDLLERALFAADVLGYAAETEGRR